MFACCEPRVSQTSKALVFRDGQVKAELVTIDNSKDDSKVMIEVIYSSVSYADGYRIQNKENFSFGNEFVGKIKKASRNSKFFKGELVHGWSDLGTVSEYLYLPENQVFSLPKDIKPEVTSCILSATWFALQHVERSTSSQESLNTQNDFTKAMVVLAYSSRAKTKPLLVADLLQEIINLIQDTLTLNKASNDKDGLVLIETIRQIHTDYTNDTTKTEKEYTEYAKKILSHFTKHLNKCDNISSEKKEIIDVDFTKALLRIFFANQSHYLPLEKEFITAVADWIDLNKKFLKKLPLPAITKSLADLKARIEDLKILKPCIFVVDVRVDSIFNKLQVSVDLDRQTPTPPEENPKYSLFRKILNLPPPKKLLNGLFSEYQPQPVRLNSDTSQGDPKTQSVEQKAPLIPQTETNEATDRNDNSN
jgi:hypothetical protein